MGRPWTRTLPAGLGRVERALRSTFLARRELRERDEELLKLRRKLNKRVEAETASAADQEHLLLDWPRGDVKLAVPSGKRVKAWEKEPFTVEWIEAELGPGEVLYDIGANAGAYSLIAATSQPSARVVSFEPSYATFALLCDNIRLNSLGDRITPVPVPLGASSRLERFRYSSVAPGAANHNEDGEVAFEQHVLTHSLDDLVARFELPPPNHVKLDVDGFEVAVLSGAIETLRRRELRTLMIELAPGDDAIEAFLADHGFTLARRHEKPVEGSVAYGLFTRAPE